MIGSSQEDFKMKEIRVLGSYVTDSKWVERTPIEITNLLHDFITGLGLTGYTVIGVKVLPVEPKEEQS